MAFDRRLKQVMLINAHLFRVCSSSSCLKIHPPKEIRCVACGLSMDLTPRTSFRNLPEREIISRGKSNREIFKGMAPAVFVDALKKIINGLELTEEQEKHKAYLHEYLKRL